MKTKNFFNTIVSIFITTILVFSSCSNGNSSSETGGGSENYKIYLLDMPETGSWGIWYWLVKTDGTKDEVSKNKGEWPKGATVITGCDSDGDFQWLKIDTNVVASLGLLFVNTANGSQQTSDVLIDVEELKKYNTFYFNFANPKEYYTDLNQAMGIMSGKITDADANTISIVTSRLSLIDKTKLSVKDSTGKALTISDVSEISANKATITLSDGNINATPYSVSYNGKTISITVSSDIIDQAFEYNGNDLGLTLSGNSATFKCWSPLAKSVNVLLYDSVDNVGNFKAETVKANASGSCTEVELKGTPSKTISMTKDSTTGVWSATEEIGTAKFYKYEITQADGIYFVADINSKSCSPDSIASEIVDINEGTTYGNKDNYVNPFGNSGTESKKYSDAVIYEMHIRDWSRAFVKDSTGKFEDITNNLRDSGKFAEHLKDLGITHVQILPMFDYAQVVSDSGYNWGYNPYHYNVPEGRYVNYSTKSGMEAVSQMRNMIKAFHDAGISVIMDVVYNHTSSNKGGSLYDSTVPEYFYRVDDSGSYLNGSGCGNETNSEHKMFKKYMIDSLKHWMLDYHINGFRFDLMGVHDTSTMEEVYKELVKIDPNVMVYGEPWTAGDKNASTPTEGAISVEPMGIGAFDDDFRDAIKGGEYGGFQKGQVQGTYNDSGIITGLVGDTGKNNRNPTGKLGLALHYVECHDNYTLYDKLNISLSASAVGSDKCVKYWKPVTQLTDTQKKLIADQNKLAAAYVFLSQGTPFINGGQEFMRTKKGNPDSYAADTKGGHTWSQKEIDECNAIDLTFKDTYSDVYNTYKGLIALRKANPSAFGANTSASATTVKAGVTKYTAGDLLVYFNATDADVAIEDATGYTKSVDVSSGTPTEAAVLPANVAAKSFVILKK